MAKQLWFIKYWESGSLFSPLAEKLLGPFNNESDAAQAYSKLKLYGQVFSVEIEVPEVQAILRREFEND